MEELMDIKEFQKDFETKDYDKAYKSIANMSIELMKKIANKRGIKLNLGTCKDTLGIISEIKYEFERNSYYFYSVQTLCELLLDWYMEELDLPENMVDNEHIKEKKLKNCIHQYNCCIKSLATYENMEEEINQKGFELLKKENVDKLAELFKEMLKYKNKSYDETWNLKTLLKEVDKYYNYYHEEFEDILNIINDGIVFKDTGLHEYEVTLNNVEIILEIKGLYKYLTNEQTGYKNFAYFYDDIKLEDGQTYDDVYEEKIQNLINIFNEMLEFAGDEEYKQRKDDLSFLIYKVGVYYPYYFDTLTHLQAMLYDVNETIISKINGMSNMYESFANNYKKFKK